MIEEEYGINNRPDSSWNPQANTKTSGINQVLSNLVQTYNLHEKNIYDTDPCMGILPAATFAVRSTYYLTKDKSPGQIVFGRDMILPINHIADWK